MKLSTLFLGVVLTPLWASSNDAPFKLERAAPASALSFDAAQNGSQPAWVEAPNVTLNPHGDWSVFVATKAPKGNYATGTVLCIGTPSDTLFTDNGHLSLTWCAPYPNAWKGGHFANSFVVTAKDDAGTSAALRAPWGERFFGTPEVKPLVGQGGFDDARAHGLVVQCRSGVVEFWSVDEAGARLMDSGSVQSSFKGVTDKPLRIGAALLIQQPAWPFTYWKQPIQSLVIYNGGCLTPVQMSRLWRGAHAGDVLDLQAARDDRYYPGSVTEGKLDELVSGKAGAITGKAAGGTPLLATSVGDDVLVDMDGYGQVLPREAAPATTSKARFWGTRVGPPTDIRLRVVRWNAPFPLPIPLNDPAQVVVDWTTVATGVGNGQTWRGDVPGVPHAFADYDCEVSWKDAAGQWTAPRRLYRRWTMGMVVGLAGQSILQGARDANGMARSFDPQVGGFLRGYYNASQGSAGYQDNAQSQGWLTRYTPAAPKTSGEYFGELRMAEKLALLAQCPVGVGNFSIGGSPIARFLGNTDPWSRWKLFIQRNRPQFGVWGNGQGDVSQTREQRFAALDRLLAQYDEAVQTAPGGPWPYRFTVFPLNGDWGLGGNADGIRSYDAEWAASRAAQGKPTGVLCFVLDEKTMDGTHLSADDAGHGLLASRMAQTFAHGLGIASHSGLGPQFDAQNSTWTVQDGVTIANLVLIPNGGTGVVTAGGDAPSGFRISIDGGAFVAPASTAIVDATHIRVTSQTVATKSVAVTYLAGAPGPTGNRQNTTKAQAGTDNALYDNRGDAVSGLPGYPVSPVPAAQPLALKPSAR